MSGSRGNGKRRNRDWRGVDSRHNDALDRNGDALDGQGNALDWDGDDWVRRLGRRWGVNFRLMVSSESSAGEGDESHGDGGELHFSLAVCVVGWFSDGREC